MSSVRTNSPRKRSRPSAALSVLHTHTHHRQLAPAAPASAPRPPRRRASQALVTLLPRAAAPATSIAPEAEALPTVEPLPAPQARDTLTGRTQPFILIVEDDPCAAHAIRDSLALEGEPDWNIQVAEDGERALALAAAQPPNVVLLDVGLPRLDGAEVYHRLRAYPRAWDTHMLFLTAATSLDLHQRGVDAGVVLRKPFEMRELVGLVRTLVAS